MLLVSAARALTVKIIANPMTENIVRTVPKSSVHCVTFMDGMCCDHRQSDDRKHCPNCSKIFSAFCHFSWMACAVSVKPLLSTIEGSGLHSRCICSVSQAVLCRIDGHAAEERAVLPWRSIQLLDIASVASYFFRAARVSTVKIIANPMTEISVLTVPKSSVHPVALRGWHVL